MKPSTFGLFLAVVFSVCWPTEQTFLPCDEICGSFVEDIDSRYRDPDTHLFCRFCRLLEDENFLKKIIQSILDIPQSTPPPDSTSKPDCSKLSPPYLPAPFNIPQLPYWPPWNPPFPPQPLKPPFLRPIPVQPPFSDLDPFYPQPLNELPVESVWDGDRQKNDQKLPNINPKTPSSTAQPSSIESAT